MKKLLFIVVLILSNYSFSQKSLDKIIYLDSLNNETTIDNFKIKRIIKNFTIVSDLYKVLEYDNSGNLLLVGNYSDKNYFIKSGEFTEYYKYSRVKSTKNYQNSRASGNYDEWYENGQKKLEAEYIYGGLLSEDEYIIYQYWDEENKQLVIDGNGFLKGNPKDHFFEEGNIKNGVKDGTWTGRVKEKYSFTEIYDNGRFFSGIRINANGEKIEYSKVESKPEFKGGMSEFYKFFLKNFEYTNAAFKNSANGKIMVRFVIDVTGKMVDIKILKGVGYGLDEEALRVLKKAGDWIPATQRGENISVDYNLPIHISSP